MSGLLRGLLEVVHVRVLPEDDGHRVQFEAGEGSGETLPARSPTARIDYVFSSDGVAIEGARVPGGNLVGEASDHRPVVADLRVEARQDES